MEIKEKQKRSSGELNNFFHKVRPYIASALDTPEYESQLDRMVEEPNILTLAGRIDNIDDILAECGDEFKEFFKEQFVESKKEFVDPDDPFYKRWTGTIKAYIQARMSTKLYKKELAHFFRGKYDKEEHRDGLKKARVEVTAELIIFSWLEQLRRRLESEALEGSEKVPLEDYLTPKCLTPEEEERWQETIEHSPFSREQVEDIFRKFGQEQISKEIKLPSWSGYSIARVEDGYVLHGPISPLEKINDPKLHEEMNFDYIYPTSVILEKEPEPV